MPRRGGTILIGHISRVAWPLLGIIPMAYWWLATIFCPVSRYGVCFYKRVGVRAMSCQYDWAGHICLYN